MTLKEIANELNVSISTVSFVLNNKEGVSEKTRKVIASKLIENGYIPSGVPKKDKSDKPKSIRFLKYAKHSQVVDGNVGFVSSIIDSAELEARNQGYHLIITSFGDKEIDDVFSMVRSQPFSGVILLGTEFEEKDYHYLDSFPSPLIVVDNHFEFYPVDVVTMDNQDIVYMAIRHLYNLGHRNIGYLHSHIQIANFAERYRAFERGIKKMGLQFNSENMFSVNATMQGSYESIAEMLEKGVSFPPAIFADNDSIAIGAIKAFKKFNYGIPEDISIVGFDDIPFCTMSEPQLTTMRVPTADIGKWTVQRLCQRIADPEIPVMKMHFSAELISRKSTKAVIIPDSQAKQNDNA